MPRKAIAASGQPTAPRATSTKRRAQRETDSRDFQIGQLDPITDKTTVDDVGIVKADAGDKVALDKHAAELAFNNEPVDIIIMPSQQKNAASIFECWTNGRKAEMFINGRWHEIGALPVNEEITVRRFTVEQIARARVTNLQTAHEDANVPMPRNTEVRQTTPVHAFSVLHDPNPRGREWLSSVMRRAF